MFLSGKVAVSTAFYVTGMFDIVFPFHVLVAA